METAHERRRRRRRGHPWLARLGVLCGFGMVVVGVGVVLLGMMITGGPAELAPEPVLGPLTVLGGVALGVGGWALARVATDL